MSDAPTKTDAGSPTHLDDVPDEQLSAVERYKRAAHRRKFGPPLTLDPAPELREDTMWRGLARDGQMRFLVVRCTNALRENCAKLKAGDEAARLIGETLISSLLLRSTLSPGERLQFIAHNNGPSGRIIGDIWSDDGMRATVQNIEIPHGMSGLGEGHLEISRTRAGKPPYRSSIPLQATIADSVMHYLLNSEQIVSLLRVELKREAGEIIFAGGYLVQMMPEGKHEDLKRMVANIDQLPRLQVGMMPADADGRAWAGQLMDGYLWDQVAREKVLFACRCSHERVLTMLSTLPRSDLEEIIGDGEPVETTCEYCHTEYRISPEQLKALLAEPS